MQFIEKQTFSSTLFSLQLKKIYKIFKIHEAFVHRLQADGKLPKRQKRGFISVEWFIIFVRFCINRKSPNSILSKKAKDFILLVVKDIPEQKNLQNELLKLLED